MKMPKMVRPEASVATVVTPQQDVVVPTIPSDWQTAQFWVALGTTVVSLLVAVGVISPTDSDHANEIVQAVAAAVAAILPAVYAFASNMLRKANKQAQAHVLASVQNRHI
jgi:hypothetical protein